MAEQSKAKILVPVYFDRAVLAELDKYVKTLKPKTSRGEVIRRAVREYLNHKVKTYDRRD